MVSRTDIQNARKQLGLDRMGAVLGNGGGQPKTADGLYYVRKIEAAGLAAAIKLPLAAGVSMTVADGIPCEIGWDEKRNQVIYPAGSQTLKASGLNPFVTNPLDPVIHAPVKTSDFPPFLCKRHGDTVSKPLTVVVYVPPVVLDTEVVLPTILEADLTAEVPAAGLRCFTVIFWLPDNTLEVQSSTPISLLDPLTAADLWEAIDASTTGSIPLWVWILENDQAILSNDPTKNSDLRQFVNMASRGGEVTTTNATATVIGTISVPELKVYTVQGRIAGTKADYSAACGGTFSATVRRASGGNVTLVGSVVTSVQEDSGASPTFTVAVNTTDQTIEILVTGVAAETYLWKAEWTIT